VGARESAGKLDPIPEELLRKDQFDQSSAVEQDAPMLNSCLRGPILAIAFSPVLAWAQSSLTPQMSTLKIDAGAVLTQALKASSLTVQGKPFHAVMDIEKAGETYSGRIEVWWVNGSKYRMVVTSPKFNQVVTVNGDQVQEKNEGDYYPRWLENFTLALLDPVPIANNLRERSLPLGQNPNKPYGCLRRDDRVNGVTDQLTYGQVCFSGSEPWVESVRTFNEFMFFSDWQKFGEKQIARTYRTDVLDEDPVVGHLTVLEELKEPDEARFAADPATLVSQRWSTSFVSARIAEGLVEKAPTIQWPTVREARPRET
jgi:hypothetical protein